MQGKGHLLISLGLFFLIQAGGISWSQTTTRVSVNSAGLEGDGPSFHPSISADGRYVAFDSDADLVAGDSGLFYDIFVRDLLAGSTTRVSVDSGGGEANGHSYSPSISANGRYVAFESDSDNLDLVINDMNGFSDIFVHDRDADGNGTYDESGGISTVRVSMYPDGTESMDPSYNPSISADGRYVAFDSDADLVAGDSGLFYDIFVRDLVAKTTTRVSVDSGGGEANGHSYSPSISANGRYVAFESLANNLLGAGNDGNGKVDIFVHDRDADGNGTYDEPGPGKISTVRVSVASGGGEANGDSSAPSISSDGNFVAFESLANNLLGVGNDTNGKVDIFVHDLQTGTTIRVSVASGGGEANGHSYSPSSSGDGRYVAFESYANNLLGVGNDINGKVDIFVHDRDADGDTIYDEVGGISTVRASVVSGGGEANGDSSAASISSDGKYVAFDSYANLVAADSGLFCDIFVNERESLPTVDSTSPAHNANGVGLGAAITATFSEPMDGSTIDTNTFTLDNGVTGTVTYDANSTTATFTPSSNLHYHTTYTATITTGAEDLAGNPMLTDYTWSFTTQSEENNSGGSGPCFIATAASDVGS